MEPTSALSTKLESYFAQFRDCFPKDDRKVGELELPHSPPYPSKRTYA